MTPEDNMHVGHYSLVDYVQMAGWSGRLLVVLLLGLGLLGVILFFKKPASGARWGYTLAALLPIFVGFTGTSTAFISNFASRGAKVASDRFYIYVIMHEAFMPLTIGFVCSALLMTLACFVWMRRAKPAGQ